VGTVGSEVIEGLNATADSFYSSQARLGDAFEDRNERLIDDLQRQYPEAVSLEMETFHLLDLARCSRGTISASACAIGLAQRKTNAFIEVRRHFYTQKTGVC
jgi:uridine phosphorylase